MFQIIAHFQDGTVLKGLAAAFSPSKGHFHLLPAESSPGTRPRAVLLTDLKAVFFVRHLEGNPAHVKRNTFDPTDLTPGRRIRVVFLDGEVLQGHTSHYQPDGKGFFVLPADQRSNNERCFVVRAATREVNLL
jgi:hypothetical protein